MGKRCSCCGEIAERTVGGGGRQSGPRREKVRAANKSTWPISPPRRRKPIFPLFPPPPAPEKKGRSLFTEAANNLDAETGEWYPFSFFFLNSFFLSLLPYSRYLSRTTVEGWFGGRRAGGEGERRRRSIFLCERATKINYFSSVRRIGLLNVRFMWIKYAVDAFVFICQSKYLDKYRTYEGTCAPPRLVLEYLSP